MNDDACFYLVLGFVMTIIFIVVIVVGAVANWYLSPTAPVMSDDDVKFLTTPHTIADLAANNLAYKERFKYVRARDDAA